MGLGGSISTESYTENAPNAFAAPFLKEGLKESQSLFHSYRPERFGNQVAGFSPLQEAQQYGTAQRALQGNPNEHGANNVAWQQMHNSQSPALSWLQGALNDPNFGGGQGQDMLQGFNTAAWGGQTALPNVAMEQLGKAAQGDYLNANPYLDQQFDAQTDAMRRAYQETTAPGTAAQFNMAGGARGAGNAYNDAVARNEGELMRGLENTASNVYANNYQQERNRQDAAAMGMGNFQLQGALGMGQLGAQQANAQTNAANSLGNQFFSGLQNQMGAAQKGMDFAMRDYENLAMLEGVGKTQQAQNQRYINDAAAEKEYYQTGAGSPIASLQRYFDPAMQYGAQFPQQYQESETENDPGILGTIGGIAGILGSFG